VWRRVVEYFDLTDRWRPEYSGQTVGTSPWGGTGPPLPEDQRKSGAGCRAVTLYAVGHYLSVVLGVLGKYFLQFTSGESLFGWHTVVAAVILAAVVFPYVYRKAITRDGTDPTQFFVSFQHGFFIQTILEQVERML